jgi:tetratricopeptide (TPR) repeat protein
MPNILTPIEVFCCYCHADEAWLRKLEIHLSLLKRQGLVALWHDRLVAPGTAWAQAVDEHLETASVILLLVSADFLASDYCYSTEMLRAVERHERGEARVIPIILYPVVWENTPFERLQVLPVGGKPVMMWESRDRAFLNVVQGIHRIILPLLNRGVPKTKEEWVLEGKGHYDGQRYEEALAAYKNALELDGEDGLVRETVGRILIELGRYEEAVGVYEEIVGTAPSASAYLFRGLALQRLGRSVEALEAYQKARELGYSG